MSLMIAFWYFATNRHMRRSLENLFFVLSLLMQLISSIQICQRRTVLGFFTGIYRNILGGIGLLAQFWLFLLSNNAICFMIMKKKILFFHWKFECYCKCLFSPSNSRKATNALILLGKVAAYALTLTGFFYCHVTPTFRLEERLRWLSSE